MLYKNPKHYTPFLLLKERVLRLTLFANLLFLFSFFFLEHRMPTTEVDHFKERKQKWIHNLSLINSCDYKDKSFKGTIDAPIRDLIEFINSLPDYRTTSSCSGRISIRSSNLTEKNQFKNLMSPSASFWWVTHEPIEQVPETIHHIISQLDDVSISFLSFKFEPAIFHIECRNLASAQHLLQIALQTGFRNSGLCLGKKHIILAIRHTSSLEAPLMYQGQWIVDLPSYLTTLFTISNQQFIQNSQRLHRFIILLKQTFSSSYPQADTIE
jgi:tRNA wybutosine-synthesizing protein 3